MKPVTLFSISREPVNLFDDGGRERVEYLGEFTVDGDGSPRCYAPEGVSGALDYLANAGRPGNWWGIATHNGESNGRPIIQGPEDPYPGFYVSTTSYKNRGFKNGDPRRELNSEIVSFLVVPLKLIPAVKGVVIGCRGRITDMRSMRSTDCVVGDAGPNNHLGEGSMKAAGNLLLPTNPKRGGSSARMFKYELWPGQAASGFELQPRGRQSASVQAAVAEAIYIRK